MEKTLIRLPNPIIITRKVYLLKNQGYGIGRTGLISCWKVLDDYKLQMRVNGLPVNLDFLDGKFFDVKQIRESLRDIVPFTPEETSLCNIESTIFGTQLLSTEYYRYFPTKKLFDFIFTGELCITFEPIDCKDFPERIEIEETYVVSEAQLIQKLDQGIPLENIGGIEEGVNMSF
jgi:hypothetical protein